MSQFFINSFVKFQIKDCLIIDKVSLTIEDNETTYLKKIKLAKFFEEKHEISI